MSDLLIGHEPTEQEKLSRKRCQSLDFAIRMNLSLEEANKRTDEDLIELAEKIYQYLNKA